MGKVLVEKLLRDCDGLSKIFVLVRTKKGVEPEQRLHDYINHMVFYKIRAETPGQLGKIYVIKGDVTVEGLGLSENDENQLIDNVNLVFHCAANLRFNETLKNAVNFNTNGTHRVLKIAEKMKNILVFTHVSTAYCHCNEEVLEERYYPVSENPFGFIEMVKVLKDDTLEMITHKLLNGFPNTYTLTKGLTEDLVYSYSHKFPIAIARPSIVTASWKTPYPGWIEGFNGPTGLMVGAGKGVIRSMHCNPDLASEGIPVDITVNALIALAFKRSQIEQNVCYFVNITDSGTNPVTWGQSLEIGRDLYKTYPFSQTLWLPNGSIKTNYYHHMFCVIFFHYLPAYVIDFFLFVFCQKPL
jgi:alcohol-forming fatty acyl-CoA reductase